MCECLSQPKTILYKANFIVGVVRKIFSFTATDFRGGSDDGREEESINVLYINASFKIKLL